MRAPFCLFMDSSFLKYYNADKERCQEKKRTSTSCGRAGSLFQYDDCVQNTATATRRTSRAHSHATAHWFTTMIAAHLPPSSRLTAATAAMQGVYSRQNTSSGAACAGVRAAVRALGAEQDDQGGHHALLGHEAGDERGGHPPVRKAQRRKQRGDIARDARQNAGLRVSGQRSCRSKFCKNQMTMVAAKMTVKAFCKKSRAFSHSSCATFFRPAGGSWAAP